MGKKWKDTNNKRDPIIKDHELTPKQRLFVEYFIQDLNATKAAIKAWYSEKVANVQWSENLAKPYIVKAIQQSLVKKFAQAWIDGQWVIDRLIELVERCMQKRPVYTKSRERVTDYYTDPDTWEEYEAWVWTFDSWWANTALANLWKYFKLFNDNPTLNVEVTTVIRKIGQKNVK